MFLVFYTKRSKSVGCIFGGVTGGETRSTSRVNFAIKVFFLLYVKQGARAREDMHIQPTTWCCPLCREIPRGCVSVCVEYRVFKVICVSMQAS